MIHTTSIVQIQELHCILGESQRSLLNIKKPVLPLSTSTQLNQKELSHILHTALSILQGSILVAFNKGISGTNRDQIVTNNCSPHYGLAAHIKMPSQCHPNNKIFGKNEIIVLRNPETSDIRSRRDSPQLSGTAHHSKKENPLHFQT